MASHHRTLPRLPRLPHPGLLRFSGAHFLAGLSLLFIVAPVVDALPRGRQIESGLLSIVLLLGVLAIAARKTILHAAVILVIPALLARWLGRFTPDSIEHATSLLFVAFVLVHLLRFILTAPRVNSEVLCAAVAGYLLLALAWSYAYLLTGTLVPGAFTFTLPAESAASLHGFNALYFSLITLTTVGFGDILPVAPVARMLAAAEAVVGMFYSTILIARLISLYSATPPSPRA